MFGAAARAGGGQASCRRGSSSMIGEIVTRQSQCGRPIHTYIRRVEGWDVGSLPSRRVVLAASPCLRDHGRNNQFFNFKPCSKLCISLRNVSNMATVKHARPLVARSSIGQRAWRLRFCDQGPRIFFDVTSTAGHPVRQCPSS
jgi:hypothetical protein